MTTEQENEDLEEDTSILWITALALGRSLLFVFGPHDFVRAIAKGGDPPN